MKIVSMFLLIAIFLGGCATASKINNVNLGMTKPGVVAAIGEPVSASAKGITEYLNYSFSETNSQASYGITVPYYVRLVNGRVDSYGRLGDFDSTQNPTINIETNEGVSIQRETTSSDKDKLYLELMKLKQLKDDGVITQEEFELEKRELLEKY